MEPIIEINVNDVFIHFYICWRSQVKNALIIQKQLPNYPLLSWVKNIKCTCVIFAFLCLLPSALRDNRIQLHRSTPTELSITISEVQLSDEGEYTCSLFTMPVRTARATVTVLGGSSKSLDEIKGFVSNRFVKYVWWESLQLENDTKCFPKFWWIFFF